MEGKGTRHLRAAAGAPVTDTAAIGAAVVAAIRQAPRGLAPRSLRAAVAEHLGVAPGALGERELQAGLGVAIATGRVDEAGGRLVAVAHERRQAG